MELIAHAGGLMRKLGRKPSGSQIQPVIVGADTAATRLAAALRENGFDVRAIRPPTVPEGTARLRIALTLNVNAMDVHALFAALTAHMG
jgi:8-amino-7-oxononanoate synthase